MIKNLWNITKVYCDNHEEPIPMQFKEGSRSVFYACPEHDNKYKGGKACPNRISTEDLEAILNMVSELIEAEEADGGSINLTGWKSHYKSTDFRILFHDPANLHIAILNKQAFR